MPQLPSVFIFIAFFEWVDNSPLKGIDRSIESRYLGERVHKENVFAEMGRR